MTDKEHTLAEKIEKLTKAINRHYLSTHVLIWRSFLQGVFFALGTTLGVSIVLTLIAFLISQLELIPVIRDFIQPSQIEQYIPNK